MVSELSTCEPEAAGVNIRAASNAPPTSSALPAHLEGDGLARQRLDEDLHGACCFFVYRSFRENELKGRVEPVQSWVYRHATGSCWTAARSPRSSCRHVDAVSVMQATFPRHDCTPRQRRPYRSAASRTSDDSSQSKPSASPPAKPAGGRGGRNGGAGWLRSCSQSIPSKNGCARSSARSAAPAQCRGARQGRARQQQQSASAAPQQLPARAWTVAWLRLPATPIRDEGSDASRRSVRSRASAGYSSAP
jgi:hypothetical protein